MDSKHSLTASGIKCHHRLWEAHTVERRRAWHDITALGLHARSDDVGRGITSQPLDCTHGRMRSVVACPQRPWTAHTVKRRRAWHAITALGQHTRSNNIGRDLPSPPLDSIHGQTMLGVACQNRVWEAHTVEQRRAWHVIIAFRQHRRSNHVRHGMT